MKKYVLTLLYFLNAYGEKFMIKIDYLKNHSEYVTLCAQWAFGEWGHYRPDLTLQTFIESQEKFLNDGHLPLTLLAFDGNTPVGMCSLAETRGLLPGLSPWLASLYVLPECRNRKIGALLEEAVCAKARTMGFTKIYLFTSDLKNVSWYEKHGWRVLSKEWHINHEVTTMEKDL